MYRFLMVDDEELVRRGFRTKIDWTNLGFEFLEPCENGEQAIEALQAFHPDVLMTDIAMPKVDGLGVAAYAAEHHPETVVVILSGYDEFEYAQKAIRSSVFEYVLKPVTSRDLAGLLGRLRTRLDARGRAREEARAAERQAQAAAALVKSQALLGLVTGPTDTLTATAFQDLFKFSPQDLCSAVVLVDEAPAPPGQKDRGAERAAEVLAGVAGASHRTLAFSVTEARWAVLVLERNPASCERLSVMVANGIAASAPAAIVGVGRPRASWREASTSYLEAAAALSYRLTGPSGAAWRYPATKPEDPRTLEGLAERKERTWRTVLSGEPGETAEQAAAFLALLGGSGVSPTSVRHEIEELFRSVLVAFRDLGVSGETVASGLHLDYDLAVQRLRTSEEVQALLRRLAEFACSTLDGRASPAPEWKVRDFKDYVARHYGDRDLSVQRIAASLSISASYLSKLVKKYLDRSVVDYLVDFRMERAKDLLATSDLMAYEVAEATGYPDAQYFSTVFKRQIGIPPSEFRAQRRRKSASS